MFNIHENKHFTGGRPHESFPSPIVSKVLYNGQLKKDCKQHEIQWRLRLI